MVWKDIYTLNYIFRLRILLIQGLFQDVRNGIGIMSNDSPLKRLRGYVCHTHARYCFVFIHTAPYISLYFCANMYQTCWLYFSLDVVRSGI